MIGKKTFLLPLIATVRECVFFVCVCENLSRLASVSVSPYVHVIPHESHGANNEIWERDYGMKANLKRRSIRGVE